MKTMFDLPRKALRVLQGVFRLLWVRVTAMGVLAVLAILTSQGVEMMLPKAWENRISGAAADRLLNLIATAMLAVTTFSLTVMVSTYHATASQFTPRIHQLIREDAITQNTLATFIGTYVYALTAIILREVAWLGDDRVLVLFCMTVLVLALIVWSLIRWMQHLQTLGSLINSARQVEDITAEQSDERLARPCLGATPWTGDRPEDGTVLPAPETGYIQIIHPEPIQAIAEKLGAQIYLLEDIGSFVFSAHRWFRWSGCRIRTISTCVNRSSATTSSSAMNAPLIRTRGSACRPWPRSRPRRCRPVSTIRGPRLT